MNDTSRLVNEALGSLFFVFLGSMAIATAMATQNNDALTIALAWALALAVAVWAFGGAGAHLNPWVTIGLALRGVVAWAAVPLIVVAQVLGALVGALLAWWLFSSSVGDNAAGAAVTHTNATGNQLLGAVAAEALVTFVLLCVVFRLIGGTGWTYGLGYGLTYGLGFLTIGVLTGSSLNLARTLGAELSLTIADSGSTTWEDVWVYLIGPAVGVVLAWLFYPRFVRNDTDDRVGVG
jgi:glycerol uptake facilitator protein